MCAYLKLFYLANEKMVHLKSHKITYCRILGYFFIFARRAGFARTNPGRAAPHYAPAGLQSGEWLAPADSPPANACNPPKGNPCLGFKPHRRMKYRPALIE
jgi:hypothetical protein